MGRPFWGAPPPGRAFFSPLPSAGVAALPPAACCVSRSRSSTPSGVSLSSHSRFSAPWPWSLPLPLPLWAGAAACAAGGAGRPGTVGFGKRPKHSAYQACGVGGRGMWACARAYVRAAPRCAQAGGQVRWRPAWRCTHLLLGGGGGLGLLFVERPHHQRPARQRTCTGWRGGRSVCPLGPATAPASARAQQWTPALTLAPRANVVTLAPGLCSSLSLPHKPHLGPAGGGQPAAHGAG